MSLEAQKKIVKVFEENNVRIVSLRTTEHFGEKVYKIYPHVNDLYICDFDKLCDDIEAQGFKTEVGSNGTTIKVK